MVSGRVQRRGAADPGDETRLARAFVAADLFDDALIGAAYQAPSGLEEWVALTRRGRSALAYLRTRLPNARPADLALAVFTHFFHGEPLVDVNRADVESIIGALSDDIRSLRLRFPWVFGRELYDAFITSDDPMRLTLEAETAEALHATAARAYSSSDSS